jgi:hypothetical protein
MEQHLKLSRDEGSLLPDPTVYRRLIGKLLYLTHTRADISYSTSRLSQFINLELLIYMQHIMFYNISKVLQGKACFSLPQIPCNLRDFVILIGLDVLIPIDQSLVSAFFLEDSLISWHSKKQSIVSRSSAKAKYRVMAITTCEITCYLSLLQDFQIAHLMAALQFCDNQAALHIAANPVFHERTKHIVVDCHFIHDKIQAGTLKTIHISSAHQLADIFTKPLGFVSFSIFFPSCVFLTSTLQLEGAY